MIEDHIRSMEQVGALSPRGYLEELSHKWDDSFTVMERSAQVLNDQLRIIGAKSDLVSEAAQLHAERMKKAVQEFENLQDAVQKVQRQEKIIRSLQFPGIMRRHDDIPAAHRNTLGWIFDTKKATFINWLEQGRGIYWVNGLVSQ